MHPPILHFLVIPLVLIAVVETPLAMDFGDDSGTYANDSQCDDRRFVGTGMAASLNNDHIGHDRKDCQRLFDAGMIAPVDAATGQAATQCTAIDFGDNSSEWSDDGECDDARFDGPGTHSIISLKDVRADANDCKSQCERGRIWLRSPAD